MAPTTPVDTIQLHSTPRMNSVSMPAAPCASVADGTAFADGTDLLPDGVGRLGKTEGKDDRHHHGNGQRAAEVADEDQPQLRSTPPNVTPGRLSKSASGQSVKTPVSRSKPSR